MADIETRLRSLLKVNAAVLGHLHVRSVLTRLASSALELSGSAHASVTDPAGGPPIEAERPGSADVARSDAVDVPLTVRGEAFATLTVSGHPGPFTPDDLELLGSLASAAAIALDKALTYEATRRRERWAQARADVRAAGSTTEAVAAVREALPGLTNAVRVEALDLAAARLAASPSDLVLPLAASGRALVAFRDPEALPLDADETARITGLVDEAMGTTTDAAPLGLYEELSPRERDVLLLIAGGLSNRQIAERLFLSEKTVKNHVTTLLRKMGMERRTQAAVYGAQLRDA